MIEKMPQIILVQSEYCDPFIQAVQVKANKAVRKTPPQTNHGGRNRHWRADAQ